MDKRKIGVLPVIFGTVLFVRSKKPVLSDVK